MQEITRLGNHIAGKAKSPVQDSNVKRFISFPILIAACIGLFFLAALLTVGTWLVIHNTQPLSSDEKTVLKHLEHHYDAKHSIDEKSRVVRIELDGPHVGDDAIDEVVKLKFLKELSLAGSSVTDSAMAKLRELKRLDHLGITNTNVSDQGLLHLQKIPSLRHVWVCENEKLTKNGIAALKRASPGISVHIMGQAK